MTFDRLQKLREAGKLPQKETEHTKVVKPVQKPIKTK